VALPDSKAYVQGFALELGQDSSYPQGQHLSGYSPVILPHHPHILFPGLTHSGDPDLAGLSMSFSAY
jgi:hypothetical protein